MPDLNSSLRLAVDTGTISFGAKETTRAIMGQKVKAVVIAKSGKGQTINDLKHLCKLENIKVLTFNGNPIELGTVCGKPYSVSCLGIIDPGTSKILEEQY